MMFQRWMTTSTLLCFFLTCSLLSDRFASVVAEDLPVLDEEREEHHEEQPEQHENHENTERHQGQVKAVGVVSLNDANFEHETQASTGQTTGSWLVWFHGSNKDLRQDQPRRQLADIVGDVPTSDDWSNLHTVLASVDVDGDGRATADRLQVTTIPSFVYIHKGKMYAYPSKNHEEAYSWQDVLSFCKDPARVSQAQTIPNPPSILDILRAKIASDPSNMMLVGAVVIVVVLGLFIRAVAGHFGSRASEDKDKVS